LTGRRLSLFGGLALACLCAGRGPASAAETQTVRFRTASELATGQLERLSLTEDGHLVLAPHHRLLAEPEDLVIWELVARRGEVLVATGTEGRLLAIRDGATRVLLEAEQAQVQTIAVDETRTWVGTSPDGAIRMADGDGDFEIVATPEARHVWRILAAGDGAVWVATGEPATVLRVEPDGQVETILTSDEAHVLALARGSDGLLYAGTAGNGYVYRIDSRGRSRVVLDPPGTEVTALLVDPAGRVFAASTGDGQGSPVPAGAPTGDDVESMEIMADGALLDATSAGAVITSTNADGDDAGPGALNGPGQSWLHRIDPDGIAELLWSSVDESVHALAWLGDELVLGTGDAGRLLAVDPESGAMSVRIELETTQITALAADGTDLLIGTASPALVFRVDASSARNGRYLSEPIDAGHLAIWGRVAVTADGAVEAATRSGNTRTPGADWDDWLECDGDVPSPPARFLQIRLELAASSRTPPRVRGIELAFLPHNLTPRITRIEVLDPHVALTVDAPQPTITGRARSRDEDPTLTSPPREEEIRGARTIRWTASDPNGDALEYAIQFRGDDETEWKTLADELTAPFHSFDSSALPDGWYRFQIAVSDHPSNPTERARASMLTSEPFLIDNRPPTVHLERPRRRDGALVAAVRVIDSASAVSWAEYALDGGAWRPLLPDDLVFDEREEQLRVTLVVAAGEHTLVVRAEDEAGNVASGKTVFSAKD